MIKKTLTYYDLDGKQITKEFHFHFSKAELVELGLIENSGHSALADTLREIAASNDPRKTMSKFREIIEQTVGRRSEDGTRFEKSPAITAEFMQSEAYGALLYEIVSNAGFAVEFIRGIMPADMQERINTKELEAMAAKQDLPAPTPPVLTEKLTREAVIGQPSRGQVVEVHRTGMDQVVADAKVAAGKALQGEMAEAAAKPRTKEDYTDQELLEMPQAEFDRLVGTNPQHMGRKYLILAFQRRAQGQ